MTNAIDELRDMLDSCNFGPMESKVVREVLVEVERLRKELDVVTKDRDDLQEKYNELVLSR